MHEEGASSAPARQRAREPARSRAECIAVERATRLLGISMRPAPGRRLARVAGAAASQAGCELLASGPLASPPPASPPPPAAFLSPLPRTRRRASVDDSTSSISQSSESQACQKLPSHIFIGDTKRLRSFATSSSTPSFISRSPFFPHSSPLSHLLLPPLQPLSLPEHVPASPSRTCNGSENYVRRGRHVVAPRRAERRG